jgi:hypothetical protein
VSKSRKAQAVTIAVLAVAVGIVVVRKNPGSVPTSIQLPQKPEDPTPQDGVYAMLDAAREGNVSAYLACYSGQMETALKQSISETTPEKFAEYLKQSNAAIKGVALMEPQPLTDREVKVRVEYVYQDRNEVQVVYLEKFGKVWKISRVDSADRVKTLVPYGTPVQ